MGPGDMPVLAMFRKLLTSFLEGCYSANIIVGDKTGVCGPRCKRENMAIIQVHKTSNLIQEQAKRSYTVAGSV